jgi:hypothetical protein
MTGLGTTFTNHTLEPARNFGTLSCPPFVSCVSTAKPGAAMPDMKAQTIILHEGDKTALQYLGAAVVLQWSNIPEDVRKALLQQSESVGGLPIVPDLHEQIQALLRRVRTSTGT